MSLFGHLLPFFHEAGFEGMGSMMAGLTLIPDLHEVYQFESEQEIEVARVGSVVKL